VEYFLGSCRIDIFTLEFSTMANLHVFNLKSKIASRCTGPTVATLAKQGTAAEDFTIKRTNGNKLKVKAGYTLSWDDYELIVKATPESSDLSFSSFFNHMLSPAETIKWKKIKTIK